jgi:hypothetical protein
MEVSDVRRRQASMIWRAACKPWKSSRKRIDYNHHRPHTGLRGLTPNEFAPGPPRAIRRRESNYQRGHNRTTSSRSKGFRNDTLPIKALSPHLNLDLTSFSPPSGSRYGQLQVLWGAPSWAGAIFRLTSVQAFRRRCDKPNPLVSRSKRK